MARMNNRELKINRIAQGMESLEGGLHWFDEVMPADRLDIMKSLNLCVSQSHPRKEEIEMGIAKSGLKDTYSPCVLIRSKPFNEACSKMLAMPLLDQRRAFVMLLSIFSIADQRRRADECGGECSHEWHNL